MYSSIFRFKACTRPGANCSKAEIEPCNMGRDVAGNSEFRTAEATVSASVFKESPGAATLAGELACRLGRLSAKLKLPSSGRLVPRTRATISCSSCVPASGSFAEIWRSEEHKSELQS